MLLPDDGLILMFRTIKWADISRGTILTFQSHRRISVFLRREDEKKGRRWVGTESFLEDFGHTSLKNSQR